MKEKEIKRFKFNDRGGLDFSINGDWVLYDDVKQYLPNDERPKKENKQTA